MDDDHLTVGGQARRAQIEAAAAEVLADSGYAAASIGRIAQRAGVSKGVITYHYASKDELLRRVAESLLAARAESVAAVTSAEMSPAVRLQARIGAELEFWALRRREFRAVAEILANHRDGDSQRAFAGVAAQELTEIAALLRDGQESGQFRDLDPEAAAHLIDAAKNGTLERWASEESLDLASMAETLLDFIEHAVQVEP